MNPPEKTTRIVLAILAGEMSIAEAARKEKVFEQSIRRWKAEFIEAGRTALVASRVRHEQRPIFALTTKRPHGSRLSGMNERLDSAGIHQRTVQPQYAAEGDKIILKPEFVRSSNRTPLTIRIKYLDMSPKAIDSAVFAMAGRNGSR